MKTYKLIKSVWLWGTQFFRGDTLTSKQIADVIIEWMLVGVNNEEDILFLRENVYTPASMDAIIASATEWLVQRGYVEELGGESLSCD